MHVLQTFRFRFRQYCETADQTHGGKATLPIDSRGGGHLPNTKGSPVYCISFLAYPQPGEFIVDTNARIIRFGEVPSQVEDGQERAIA
jgi:hypothetical protein